jgi:Tfp pilus assembly protein PilP
MNIETEEEGKKQNETSTTAAVSGNTQMASTHFLPPLQRYSINDFKLVAIGGTSDSKIAIVKDAKGKSYRLSRDTKIGMHDGRVIDITDSQVTIMEKTRDPQGKVTPSTVILQFIKEKIEVDK